MADTFFCQLIPQEKIDEWDKQLEKYDCFLGMNNGVCNICMKFEHLPAEIIARGTVNSTKRVNEDVLNVSARVDEIELKFGRPELLAGSYV